jgi:RNA polymerase sigma factor (TIGR02999 family)
MDDASKDITLLIARMKDGDQAASSELVPILYRELRRLASSLMRHERAGHTLQPTALVHEAYLSLLGHHASVENRAHFMGLAAMVMRRILLQYARRRSTLKRRVLDAEPSQTEGMDLERIVVVDEALKRLHTLSPRQAQIAEMRYFAGLSVDEVAEALDISPRSVKREWAIAKGWLHAELSGKELE